MNYIPSATAVPFADCHLRQLPSLQDFSDDELRTVEQLELGHRRAERDAVLLRAGEEAAPTFTLFTGWAFRFRLLPDGRRQLLGILLPGDTVGLETLLGEPPAYSVQAASDVTMCLLDAPRTAQCMIVEPWLRQRIFAMLCKEREAGGRAADPHRPVRRGGARDLASARLAYPVAAARTRNRPQLFARAEAAAHRRLARAQRDPSEPRPAPPAWPRAGHDHGAQSHPAGYPCFGAAGDDPAAPDKAAAR